MTKRLKLLGPAAAALSVLILGVAAASGTLNVANPETAQSNVLPPPRLLPPGAEGYVGQPADQPIAAPDGRPVAQLANPPADLPNVAVRLPQAQQEQARDKVSFRILSSVQYAGNGQQVYVSLTVPSAAAAQKQLLLGNETVTLPNGTTAWVQTDMPGDVPNQVVWADGERIITVAGNVSAERLKALATDVTLQAP